MRILFLGDIVGPAGVTFLRRGPPAGVARGGGGLGVGHAGDDAHAEATADKYLLGHHLKGRVSAVLGTHTHVPTADEQILPGGTAFISDVGMTGPYDSILGRRIDRVLGTTITFVPSPFDVAEGDPRLGGAIVDVDTATGQATGIRRVMLDEKGLEALAQRVAAGETRPPTPPVL